LKHQWPTIVRIVELHWRDFAVFVSLSSRTNTRQGLRLCDASGVKPVRASRQVPILLRKWSLGACSSVG
jgi:hypothetical protein